MDILDINERIKLSIDLGESQWREFKSAFEGPEDGKVPRSADEIKVDIDNEKTFENFQALLAIISLLQVPVAMTAP